MSGERARTFPPRFRTAGPLVDAATGETLVERVELADTYWTRLAGLQFREGLSGGLLIAPCGSVHTLFMRFAIDVVFLDGEGVVVGVRRGVRPWRTAGVKGAKVVLELPAGAVQELGERLMEGTRLVLRGATDRPRLRTLRPARTAGGGR